MQFVTKSLQTKLIALPFSSNAISPATKSAMPNLVSDGNNQQLAGR